jgi:2-(1,2-epoxy-1,2-dihydrophenyl)acetyl-CoA isomerase
MGGEAKVNVTRHGAVAELEIDFTTRRNALSLELRELMHDAMAELQADTSVRCIVLTGAGGVFSAGGDIKSMDGLTPLAGRARLQRLHRLVRLLIEGETPVVAAVEGYAVGAGLSLAAACDIVVAAEDVVWSCAFNKLGLMPDMGSAWTLPARMGLGRARRIMLTSERFGTAQAVDWGLAEESVAKGQARERAHAMAADIAERAPGAVAVTKAWLARGPMGLGEVLAAEADAQAMLFATEDFAEGRAAFADKRAARFEGK